MPLAAIQKSKILVFFAVIATFLVGPFTRPAHAIVVMTDDVEGGMTADPTVNSKPFVNNGALRVMHHAYLNSNDYFLGAKRVVYYIAALGMIALAIMGFFGRWKWTWFMMWCLGLILLGGIQTLIDNLGIHNY